MTRIMLITYQLKGNDLTLKVGLDISSVESSAYKIQDIMSSVNNPSLSAAGINADYTSRTMSKDKRSANNGTPVTNNNSSDYTYNNVFNILKNTVLVVINTPTKICGITLPVQLTYRYLAVFMISEIDVIFK